MNYIVDNKEYILGKSIDGKPVSNFEVHDIIKGIIFEIDRICRKNKIDYALSFGSALGLYNYGGFIPWDDDGDIVINYFDYERFVNALKSELSDDYIIDTELTNEKFNPLIPAIKVRYKHSFIKEKTDITLPSRGCKNRGIFVDVCLFMGVPQNKKEHLRLIRKSKLMMPFYVIGDAFFRLNLKGMRKSLRKYENGVATKYINSDYVSQTVIIPFQEYPRKIVHSLSFPKEVIYPFKEYDFDGKKIYSFNNIEEFCRLRYGESALKKLNENGEYIDPYPKKNKKAGHIRRIEIYKNL